MPVPILGTLAAVAALAAWMTADAGTHGTAARASDSNRTAPAFSHEFTNPIVPARGPGGSADPSVVYRNGYYYYCRSLFNRAVGVARAKRLQDIGTAPMKPVWAPPEGTPYSSQLWAPELQYLRGKWYIYVAASDGDNAHHRMVVLESETQDPRRGYRFKGRIAAPDDQWAIDGLAFESGGSLYFMWSGWRHAGDGFPQVTYIAPMSNPWTIAGQRHEIAAPDRPWEQSGAPLMEGPSVLRRGGKLFVVYSASGSWTDDYTLGMLTYSTGDILDAASWSKAAAPVFSKRVDGGAFGPGHNTFVKSPDGKEDWIVYHAIDTPHGGWSRRSVRAQRLRWNADGTPSFGSPVGIGVPIREPSGTERPRSHAGRRAPGRTLASASRPQVRRARRGPAP